MKKRLIAAFTVLLLACSTAFSSTFTASTKQFSDVPSSKHFAEAVYNLAERNIIGGYPDGTFKPGKTLTRGQAAVIIAKMINLDTSNVNNPGFKDVSTANTYYKAIAAMAEQGIISGYWDGRFGPNDPIKRSQMASILVKAFDLPRYHKATHEMINPFKDVLPYYNLPSHDDNILILYRLGIAGGTSPDKFSPNAFLTRGQAAKMLKATEELKPVMDTIGLTVLELESIEFIRAEHTDSSLLDAILVNGNVLPTRETKDRIQLIPLKEGTSTLIVSGSKDGKKINKKYDVHIIKENGRLKTSLAAKGVFQPTTVEVPVSDETRNQSSQSVKKVSFTLMNGGKISDNLKFEHCQSNNSVCFDIDQPGQYIATVHFIDGEEVRYGIDASINQTSLYYDIKILKEQLSDSYDLGTENNIGKHTIRTNDAKQIATVTRNQGTNLFHATASRLKEGTVYIDFEHKITSKSCEDTDCKTTILKGIYVKVEHLGYIVNTRISPLVEANN